jgi:hypothetical protein
VEESHSYSQTEDGLPPSAFRLPPERGGGRCATSGGWRSVRRSGPEGDTL